MRVPVSVTLILLLAGGCGGKDQSGNIEKLRREAARRHETVKTLAKDVQTLRKEQQQALEQIRALRSEVHRLSEQLHKAHKARPPVPVKIVGPKVRLTIRSTPMGARIYKDGKLLGVTPLVVQVRRGGPQTLLTFRKAGYADHRVSVFTRQDQQIQVALRRR